mmetsp:Transcript_125554/g.287662  ORF Transcript_125554/g.287662 Transcript_125554/m.287662 type:complete len:106 (+) Transcript_125554:221-538(+)
MYPFKILLARAIASPMQDTDSGSAVVCRGKIGRPRQGTGALPLATPTRFCFCCAAAIKMSWKRESASEFDMLQVVLCAPALHEDSGSEVLGKHHSSNVLVKVDAW